MAFCVGYLSHARAWLAPPQWDSVAAIEANGLDLRVRAVQFREQHPYEHADDGGRPGFVFREKIRDEAGVGRPGRRDQW